MTIREQAWQAFTSSQQSAIDAAEAALFDILAGLNVEELPHMLNRATAPQAARAQGRMTAVHSVWVLA